ncbi:hypothetical protein ACFL96_03530 [Thermoproteota archaeon]
MEPDEDLYERLEKFFDIRTDGIYTKLGGIKNTLQLMTDLDIPVYGTRIRTSDMQILLATYNERNPDNQILPTEEGLRWANQTGTVKIVEPKNSSLEDSIMSVVEGYTENQKAFNNMREKLSTETTRNILEEYFTAIRNKAYDPNDVKLASTLIKDMRTRKIGMDSETLETMLGSTASFVHKYKTPEIMDFINNVFKYALDLDRKQLTPNAMKYFDRIHSALGNVFRMNRSSDKEASTAICKSGANINKKAFTLYRNIQTTSRENTKRLRISAWHYMQNMHRLYGLSESDGEKKHLVNEALDMCGKVLGKAVSKDTLAYANINYWATVFSYEKYVLTNERKYLGEAKNHLGRARNDVRNIWNKDFASDLLSKLTAVERKMTNG